MPSAEGHTGKTEDHKKEVNLAVESFKKTKECETDSSRKQSRVVRGQGTTEERYQKVCVVG